MKLTKEKLLIFGDKYEKTGGDIGEDRIWGTSNMELLRIAIDNKLEFDRHISNFCSKANNKISIIKQTLKKEEH